jgi:hypothetical protein
VAETFIKPNDRLTSVQRLEIYNRQYWFRLIDCLYDDYPGVRAVLGEREFAKLVKSYLAKHPSTSFTLRNLGRHLPSVVGQPMARDMARLEWARIVAFDEAALPEVTIDDLLDAKPDRLRLALQPYLTLLKLRYPLDDYLIALKTDSLRTEASNAVTDASHRLVKKLRRPKAQTVYVAVHRVHNAVYYKRLTAPQIRVLEAIRAGKTLSQACAQAATGNLQEWFRSWASFGWFCRSTGR